MSIILEAEYLIIINGNHAHEKWQSTGALSAQAGWLGLRVSGHNSAAAADWLSEQSSNERGEFSQRLGQDGKQHKNWH